MKFLKSLAVVCLIFLVWGCSNPNKPAPEPTPTPVPTAIPGVQNGFLKLNYSVYGTGGNPATVFLNLSDSENPAVVLSTYFVNDSFYPLTEKLIYLTGNHLYNLTIQSNGVSNSLPLTLDGDKTLGVTVRYVGGLYSYTFGLN